MSVPKGSPLRCRSCGCSLWGDHEFGRCIPCLNLRDRMALAVVGSVYSESDTRGFERVAHISYQMADELMEARKK